MCLGDLIDKHSHIAKLEAVPLKLKLAKLSCGKDNQTKISLLPVGCVGNGDICKSKTPQHLSNRENCRLGITTQMINWTEGDNKEHWSDSVQIIMHQQEEKSDQDLIFLAQNRQKNEPRCLEKILMI